LKDQGMFVEGGILKRGRGGWKGGFDRGNHQLMEAVLQRKMLNAASFPGVRMREARKKSRRGR